MDAQQFAYWLQGFAELNQTAPNDEQWRAIRDHLALVFHKVTQHRLYGEVLPAKPVDAGLGTTVLARCMGGQQCTHLPGTCTAQPANLLKATC